MALLIPVDLLWTHNSSAWMSFLNKPSLLRLKYMISGDKLYFFLFYIMTDNESDFSNEIKTKPIKIHC